MNYNFPTKKQNWGATDVSKGDWGNWSGGPGGSVMANNPISQLDRQGRLTRMAREAGAPMPQDTMPPISSRPNTGMGYQEGTNNPVDENGIPLVLTSVGWVKDSRFYRPDGTLIGMM